MSEGGISGIVSHYEDGLSPRVEIDEDLHNLVARLSWRATTTSSTWICDPTSTRCDIKSCWKRWRDKSMMVRFSGS